MAETMEYVCEECGNRIQMDVPDQAPECCGQRMKKDMDVCLTKPTGEQYRFNDDDEPCDDGTEGIKR